MAKLWQKALPLDELIERFTVGRDDQLDQSLVPADAMGSMAQARQLARLGLLTEDDAERLVAELRVLVLDWKAGSFRVERSDEDCHTAIENRLTARLGDLGKSIHTGRSRNDQVLTALRIFGRSRLGQIRQTTLDLVDALVVFARQHQTVPMPGRTHLQTGMPSSVGLWASAWAEELLDSLTLAEAVYRLIDRSPLGFAASYGVPLPLDREFTAELMGFSRVHRNVLAASHSRGKGEAEVLDVLDQVGLTLSRMAQDLILFSLPEFGYFELPAELCTGSSIMPQKKNPDALELTRAKSSALSAWSILIKNVLRNLPSGYNRDLQETKEPFFRGLETAFDLVAIMRLTVQRLQVHPAALAKAFTPDIFATDAPYDLVRQGVPFRDAYREVGAHLDHLESRDPQQTVFNRTHTGSAGNLGLDLLQREADELRARCVLDRQRIVDALSALAGTEVFESSGL